MLRFAGRPTSARPFLTGGEDEALAYVLDVLAFACCSAGRLCACRRHICSIWPNWTRFHGNAEVCADHLPEWPRWRAPHASPLGRRRLAIAARLERRREWVGHSGTGCGRRAAGLCAANARTTADRVRRWP